MLNSYHKSFLSKLSSLFDGVVVSGVIYVFDEDEEIINNVVFLSVKAGCVAGFYINGSNPFISTNHFDEFDDFNLYALYDVLHEKKSNILLPFKVEYMKVFFHPSYNEIVSVFFSSLDFSSSIFIVFSNDEIYVYENCKEDCLIKILKDNLIQFKSVDFQIFQRNIGESRWNIVDVE